MCDLKCFFCCAVQSEDTGSPPSCCTSGLNQIIDNSCDQAEPGADFRGQCSLLQDFVFILLKDICFVKLTQYMMHEQHMRSRSTEMQFYRYQRWKTPERSSRRPVPLSLDPLTFDVRQYNSEHKRVMFSNVKAAICGGDLGFDRSSSPDFGLSGFSSIS